MTTYLKLMQDDGKSDTDAWKAYVIYSLQDGAVVSFDRYTGERVDVRYEAHVMFNGDGFNGALPLVGNAYLMSETGKTIASHGC